MGLGQSQRSAAVIPRAGALNQPPLLHSAEVAFVAALHLLGTIASFHLTPDSH